MHMADALLTPAVAGVMYAASAVVAGASIVELHKEEKQDLTSAAKKLPTMAVMSALVFAGQMINYTIPGTGSSGHLCGGLLLTSVLGPWAGFLSMIVILTIQCLFFADGGLLALGANVWNMAFYGCFVGYFLIYRPLMRSRCFARRGERAANRLKITLASVLGCVLTLQLGAFSVVLETTLSGITDLPFGAFCAIMQPIHLAIGLIEGLITAAVLLFFIFRSACMKDGSVDYFLLWLLCGLPFGIHRMFLWIIPGGRSFGGSIAVFALNFLIGAVIGGVVLVWRLLVAVWYVPLTAYRLIKG